MLYEMAEPKVSHELFEPMNGGPGTEAVDQVTMPEQAAPHTEQDVQLVQDGGTSPAVTEKEVDGGQPVPPSRHVAAGRKGAQRVHQLIQEGKLYEQEHGLKRGRQRLRQLIELGKLYEQEHGLRNGEHSRKVKRVRVSKDQALADFVRALSRLVKPSLRPELVRLLEVLKVEQQ